MSTFFVSLNCIYSTEIEADNPEQAADLAEAECPLEVNGYAFVKNLETEEEFDKV